jgi:branched-chain amino acid transport system substrate-binding protein
MSGNAAAQGQSIRESVEMAVNLKNSAGGLLGRPIEVVIGDDAGKPEEAAVVARRFASRDQVTLAIRGAGISRGRGAADRGERDCSTHHDAGQRVGIPLCRA